MTPEELHGYVEARIEALKDVMYERDRRYEERFRGHEVAVNAALAAQEKFNSAVTESSREAILKAEASQKGVNERSNEFRGQLADQAATLMPRKESEAAVAALREKFEGEIALLRADIVSLRETRSAEEGQRGGKLTHQHLVTWLIGIAVFVMAVIQFLKK